MQHALSTIASNVLVIGQQVLTNRLIAAPAKDRARKVQV